MKFSTAAVLAVILSGCGDDTHAGPNVVTVIGQPNPSYKVPGRPNPSYEVSPKNEEKNIGPDREGSQLVANVGRLVAQFEQVRARIEADASAILATHAPVGEVCPPPEITIRESRVVLIQPWYGVEVGPGTHIHVASVASVIDDRSEWLQVKVCGTVDAVRAMAREAAFQFVTLGVGAPAAPMIYDIVPNSDRISEHCRLRTLISDYFGPESFPDRMRAYGGSKRPARAAFRIKQAIDSIKTVHKNGFVHGDVQAKNFGYGPLTLQLIGFERVQPYIDESGGHVLNSASGVASDDHHAPLAAAAELVYPWDLEGSRLSRRNDIFRVAEIALQVAGLDEPFAAGMAAERVRFVMDYPDRHVDSIPEYREAIRELKRNRPSLAIPAVPAVYSEFYLYALHLDFDSVPAYDRWIDAFTDYYRSQGSP